MLRVGNSIDIHNLVKQKKYRQKICGILIDENYKILAHSDGDIVLHAISESILGALGLGDLGLLFSDKSEANKNLNSEIIIDYCLNKMIENNYKLINLDVSIVCEQIYLSKYRNKMINYLIHKFKNDAINIKFTRFENNLDYRIICYATILLIKKDKISIL